MDEKIEEIIWVDSNGRGRWDSIESYMEYAKNENLECKTAGYVVYESDDRVAVVTSMSPKSYDGMMVIPKVAILNRVVMVKK